MLLDRKPRNLRHSWTLPVWPINSRVMTLAIRASWLELRGAENRWNQLNRTGAVSIEGRVDNEDRSLWC